MESRSRQAERAGDGCPQAVAGTAPRLAAPRRLPPTERNVRSGAAAAAARAHAARTSPADLPDLVSRRDSMPAVEQWQTAYVRYKTQLEAAATGVGWQLAESRRFAEKLAAGGGSAFAEDSLLYDGLAPARVTLRIVDAPAEYAVPVKQDRCARRPRRGAGGLRGCSSGGERPRRRQLVAAAAAAGCCCRLLLQAVAARGLPGASISHSCRSSRPPPRLSARRPSRAGPAPGNSNAAAQAAADDLPTSPATPTQAPDPKL